MATVAVAAGVAGLAAVVSGGPASANPTGASPQVFVAGPGSSSNGPYDQFNLSSLQAGGAGPTASGALAAPVAAMAMNPTATKVVYGLLALPGAVPAIAVEDVASRAVTRVSTGFSPVGIAADPSDASRAYVLEYPNANQAGQIDTVGIGTSPPTDAVLSTNTGRVVTPTEIAISPDGATLFVCGVSRNTPYLTGMAVANPGQTSPWSFNGHGGSIVDIAVAPAGNALYAVSSGTNPASGALDDWVLALALPLKSGAAPLWTQQLAAGSPLSVPTSVTVSPDASTVYVTGNAGAGGSSAVEAFSASSGAPGANQVVGIARGDGTSGGLVSEAISPDGSTLVAVGTDGSTGQSFADSMPLPSLAPVRSNPIGTGFGTLTGPEQVVITPDQAPVASFTSSPGSAGSPTSLDAGSSTVAYGSVTTFAWNFGDGHTANTTTQQTTHVYATAGTYTATLVETDSAGTSVPPAVFLTAYSVDGPGQTPYRRADNSARTTRAVVVPPRGTAATTTTTTPPVISVPGKPALVLNPALGPPGTLVTVTGTGFPANTPITVSWSVSTGSVVITSDGAGNLPPTILPVLVPDVLGPRSAVSATSPAAQAPFLVVPGSAEPGGNQGSYLFRSEGP